MLRRTFLYLLANISTSVAFCSLFLPLYRPARHQYLSLLMFFHLPVFLKLFSKTYISLVWLQVCIPEF